MQELDTFPTKSLIDNLYAKIKAQEEEIAKLKEELRLATSTQIVSP